MTTAHGMAAVHPALYTHRQTTLFLLSASCGLRSCKNRARSVSWPEVTLGWVTEFSRSLDHESGTVYPALGDSLTWTLTVQNDYWRHSCLSETAAHLFVLCAMYKSIYSVTVLKGLPNHGSVCIVSQSKFFYLCFWCFRFTIFWLSVSVQLIAWKDLSVK